MKRAREQKLEKNTSKQKGTNSRDFLFGLSGA